jgi:hypothetical protein
MGNAISSSGKDVTASTQATLQLSFASAEDLAAHEPQYASQITSAARSSFLDGDQWAYGAAILAIVIGIALVFRFFPRHEREVELRHGYHEQDSAPPAPGAQEGVPAPVS